MRVAKTLATIDAMERKRRDREGQRRALERFSLRVGNLDISDRACMIVKDALREEIEKLST